MKAGILILLLALAGCGKSDTIAPVILLTGPAQQQVFAAGETVTVSADISDENSLHMIHLVVTDNTGGHIIHFEEHYDGKSYSLHKSFVAQGGKTYAIEVGATDHNDNTAKANITVSAN